MQPSELCAKYNLSSREFIERVQEVAPKYSKATNCMANNLEYGVMLRPFVTAHIRGKPENRRLPCRVQFRVTQRQRERLTAAMDVMNYATMQELIAFIVNGFLDKLDDEVDGGLP